VNKCGFHRVRVMVATPWVVERRGPKRDVSGKVIERPSEANAAGLYICGEMLVSERDSRAFAATVLETSAGRIPTIVDIRHNPRNGRNQPCYKRREHFPKALCRSLRSYVWQGLQGKRVLKKRGKRVLKKRVAGLRCATRVESAITIEQLLTRKRSREQPLLLRAILALNVIL